MADRIMHTTRNYQAYAPLPHDVLPKIFLHVQDRQAFTRLACTCHGFYAWSEPWLKSRRHAAELSTDPQWRVKLPAWIKTNSHHLHPADWKALQHLEVDKKRIELDSKRLDMRTWDNPGPDLPPVPVIKAASPDGGASRMDTVNYLNLDFILFSPRLLADVNPEAGREAHARLVRNTEHLYFNFEPPTGEAWQYDLLAGATAWLNENKGTITAQARLLLIFCLDPAMRSIMVAQRSPALALYFLEHGLVKSHYDKVFGLDGETPSLKALVGAMSDCKPQAGSSEASAFVGALHQMVTTLEQANENRALLFLVDHLKDVIKIIPEKTWSPGSAGTDCLHALVRAVRGLPDALADLRKILIKKSFITAVEWEKLLLTLPGTTS